MWGYVGVFAVMPYSEAHCKAVGQGRVPLCPVRGSADPRSEGAASESDGKNESLNLVVGPGFNFCE